MPIPKRERRASGVARSLGAANRGLVKCPSCKRKLPRESMAFVFGPRTMRELKLPDEWHGFCGECWHGSDQKAMRWLGAHWLAEHLVEGRSK